MSIDKHVVSLELAKQLYEAGIVVESEFWWEEAYQAGTPFNTFWLIRFGKPEHKNKNLSNPVPAPLASEIGERLGNHASIYKLSRSWHCEWNDTFGYKWSKTMGDTMVEAIAKMLLHLNSQGLLPKEEV